MSENYFYSSLSAQEIEDTLVGAVRFNSNQSLTTSQKEQARQNIGAGASDTKIIIEGFYDTLADLQSQIPVGTAGDVYAVGTASPYNLYIWDAISNTWKNNGAITLSDAVIDDEDIALDTTWSSSKIYTQLSGKATPADVAAIIDDTGTAADTTWSSDKISSELNAIIDDTDTAADTTWSSQKTNSEIAAVWEEESITVTVDTTKITFTSWGGVTAKKIGNIMFVAFSGVKAVSAISTATIVATISGVSPKTSVYSPIFAFGESTHGIASIEGSNSVMFNGMTSTSAECFVQFVVPV